MRILFNKYSRSIDKKNSLSNKLIRLTTKLSLNIFIPLYYKINKRNSGNEIDVIVSLTTFPERIGRTWIVIESLLRQTLKPKKIILTLSRLQFVSEESLPKELISLKNENLLEIIWTEEDLRSHKKYFYAMKRYPNDIVITVDDDFIYEKNMIATLYNFHILYPTCIVTNLALEKKGLNYHEWQNLLFSMKEPSYSIMQLGGSGVLYPASSLHPDAFSMDIILKKCPLADDIWLNTMAIINSTKILKTDYDIYPMPLLFRFNKELYTENLLNNKNNEQIKNLEDLYGSEVFSNN